MSTWSEVYNLPTEQLQRNFEECTSDIEELEEKLKAWHMRKYPLLKIMSMVRLCLSPEC